MNIHTYASDYNDYAVPALIDDPVRWWTHPEAFFVKTYLGSEDAVRCPSVGPPFEFTRTWQHIPRENNPSPNRWQEEDRWSGGALSDYATTAEYCAPETGIAPPEWILYYPPAQLTKHQGGFTPNSAGQKGVGQMPGTSPASSHLVYDNRNSGPLSFESADSYAPAQGMKAPRHIDGYTANVGYVDGHVARFHLKRFGITPTIPH